MKTSRAAQIVGLTAFVGVFSAGCDQPALRSDLGQVGFEVEGLVLEALHDASDGAHVIEGSRLCPQFEGWYDGDGNYRSDEDVADDPRLRACFGLSTQGPIDGDGDCFELNAPGEAAILLAPQSCALDDEVTFAPDRLTIDVHGIDDARIAYDDLTLRFLYADLHPGPLGAFAAAPPEAPDGRWWVVAGERVAVRPQPWAISEPTLALAYSDATPVVSSGAPTDVTVDDATMHLVPAPGDEAALALELAAGTLVGPPLESVDGASATSLTLVVGWEACDDCEQGYGLPLLVQPIVTDGSGRRLHGADVVWSFEGRGSLDDEDLPGDGVLLSSLCEDGDAGQSLHARVDASYRALATQVELDYVCPEPAQADAPVGCQCTAAAMRPQAGLVPAAWAFALWRVGQRRRRRSCTSKP